MKQTTLERRRIPSTAKACREKKSYWEGGGAYEQKQHRTLFCLPQRQSLPEKKEKEMRGETPASKKHQTL